MENDMDDDFSSGEEDTGEVSNIEAPQNRKKLNTVVSKLDQILIRDESNVLIAKLEKIIEKKKRLDEERIEKSINGLT
jgi:hypothetical protein